MLGSFELSRVVRATRLRTVITSPFIAKEGFSPPLPPPSGTVATSGRPPYHQPLRLAGCGCLTLPSPTPTPRYALQGCLPPEGRGTSATAHLKIQAPGECPPRAGMLIYRRRYLETRPEFCQQSQSLQTPIHTVRSPRECEIQLARPAQAGAVVPGPGSPLSPK